MGKAIEKLAYPKHDIGLKIGKKNAHEFTAGSLEGIDVAIDFSLPDIAVDNIKTCIDAGVPVVSGTTGWLERKDEVDQYCLKKGGAFLYASNFSVGVNLFFVLNSKLAELMNDRKEYGISMKEIHHIHKLDAPSGTGISLANGIIDKVERKTGWQEGQTDDSSVIPIESERFEMTPGTHIVYYDSPIDSIEIKHTAHSRDGFASGAILAAEWLHGKTGVFTMADVLGL